MILLGGFIISTEWWTINRDEWNIIGISCNKFSLEVTQNYGYFIFI